MQAELGSARVWLKAGNIANARSEAGHFLESALSTPAPNLQAIAWAMNARVAMAENEWGGAEECIQKALAVLERFAIPVAAWQIHATAWRLYRHTGGQETASKHSTTAPGALLVHTTAFS